MPFRVKAFVFHLLAGCAVVLVLMGVGLWKTPYGFPGWYLVGADKIFLTLAGVDLCIGPLLTLVVTNPKKPKREQIRDWAIIVIVQVLALAWGVGALWSGRPIAYVFAVDRIEVVTANQYSPEELARVSACAREAVPFALPWKGCFVEAVLPKDPEKKSEILFSALGGRDVSVMPDYYVNLRGSSENIRKRLIPTNSLASERPELKGALRRIEGRFPGKALGLLWVLGKKREAWLVFDRDKLIYLDLVY